MKKRKKARLFLLLLPLSLVVCLALSCQGPLKVEPLGQCPIPLSVDTRLELARAYAPWIYHGTHPSQGRQDLPTRIDFDGDMRGDNNWESMPRFELPPTLYYAVLESQTHYFLSYHLFHPRDWSFMRIGIHLTHENDGENLQVVVDKASGRVVLLTTQAHYFGYAYANPGSGFAEGKEESLEGPLLLVDEQGRPDPTGKRAAVYVQSCGHGIYGLGDSSAGASLSPEGKAEFSEFGLVFRAGQPGEEIREPELRVQAPVPYQLESLTAKVWPGVRDGSLLGEGGILDGTVIYESRFGPRPVPRYYEGDRFSGPFGPDRGIGPFALDFSFSEGEVGALFFDPALRYSQCLTVPEPWSLEYVDYPFQ